MFHLRRILLGNIRGGPYLNFCINISVQVTRLAKPKKREKRGFKLCSSIFLLLKRFLVVSLCADAIHKPDTS
jgi:hypothetical protein